MKELTLFTVETPYRESLPVRGWQFGNPAKKSLAIMGALRGNEIQQMFLCSQLIRRLSEIEPMLSPDCGILVVPCANQFSMNVGSRFWAADNTDINRMFPGYDLGETTQRIAARLFSALQGYTYGIQMASFYLPGDHIPHIRMMDTGYQRSEEAIDFGLPYIILRTPQPYDTTTLNYNWQVWNTQAFSLYSTETDSIELNSADVAINAVLRFLYNKSLSSYAVKSSGIMPKVIAEHSLVTVLSSGGGIFLRSSVPGEHVEEGDILAEILDPCTGAVLESLAAPCGGRVFFAHKAQLIAGHEVAFRILSSEI